MHRSPQSGSHVSQPTARYHLRRGRAQRQSNDVHRLHGLRFHGSRGGDLGNESSHRKIVPEVRGASRLAENDIQPALSDPNHKQIERHTGIAPR